MMTVKEVLELVKEFKVETTKTTQVPHYYKRNGKILERSYPDTVYTERYKELRVILESNDAKVFKCKSCGKMVSYFHLEKWLCDFEQGKYLCSQCYETGMGEDL